VDSISTPKTKTAGKVLLTERMVPSSEAYAQVPPGCRMATLEEVSIAWKTDQEFRNKINLYNPIKVFVWVDKKGLKSGGLHRIEEDGSHVPSDNANAFETFEARDLSYRYPWARGQVIVYGYERKPEECTPATASMGKGYLGVLADGAEIYAGCVAYVRLEEDKPKISAVLRV
jgi:hypothetical protein